MPVFKITAFGADRACQLGDMVEPAVPFFLMPALLITYDHIHKSSPCFQTIINAANYVFKTYLCLYQRSITIAI
jgi:hypothetical protein